MAEGLLRMTHESNIFLNPLHAPLRVGRNWKTEKLFSPAKERKLRKTHEEKSFVTFAFFVVKTAFSSIGLL
jgi:hypothetical protein